MLLFIVLATLLCSSLVDALKAPVNSAEALKECLNLKQLSCKNTALEIKEDEKFHPTIKVSGVEKLKLAVQSSEPLTFQVHSEKYQVRWKVTYPGNCWWNIVSDNDGTVKFQEMMGTEKKDYGSCDADVGSDVDIAVDISGRSVEFNGKCKKSEKVKLECEYAPLDSASLPDYDVWTLSISATDKPNPAARIKLTDAYVVYDAPDTTTTMTPDYNGTDVTGNGSVTTPSTHTNSSTADVGLSITTYALYGVSALFAVL